MSKREYQRLYKIKHQSHRCPEKRGYFCEVCLCYFARVSGCEVLWWVGLCLYLGVSVREDISGTKRAIFTTFLCMMPMSVARSFSGMLMTGRIAYRREGGDGSAQPWRSVIYDCLVPNFCQMLIDFNNSPTERFSDRLGSY